MSSIDIKIGGILLFSDESITKLNIGNGYIIKKCDIGDLFYKHKLRYEDGELLIDYFESNLGEDKNNASFICIEKDDMQEVDDEKELNRIKGVINPDIYQPFVDNYKLQEMKYLQMIFHLMRVFKTGNFGPADLIFVFDCQCLNLIRPKFNIKHIFAGRNVYDDRIFSLTLNEQLDCQRFIERYSDGAYDLIISAINQFALGLERMGDYGGYLEFVTSLEMLLLKEDDGIKQRFAKRTAVLLGSTRKEKKVLYDKMIIHYENRSKVVHEGKSSDISLEACRELEEITRKVIKRILEKCRVELIDNPLIEWRQVKNKIIRELISKVEEADAEKIFD